MTRARVRHQGQRSIYIHNDLGGATRYFRERVDERVKNEDKNGIAFEYMSLLTMLAFEFEARINFLGYKLINGWKEKDKIKNKMKAICKLLGIDIDLNKRPFSSIDRLILFRNTIAHGKPFEEGFDVILDKDVSDLDASIDLTGMWEEYCAHDVASEIHEDAENLWKLMLKQSGLSIYETLSRGSGGLTLIDKIEDHGK